jgi:hypothetical protein
VENHIKMGAVTGFMDLFEPAPVFHSNIVVSLTLTEVL